MNLVYSAADVQGSPDEKAMKRELGEQAKHVTEKVSNGGGDGGKEREWKGGRERAKKLEREWREEGQQFNREGVFDELLY